MKLDETFNLTGRTALVTGSSRGIGASIAKALAGAGAHVVIHGRTASAEAAEMCEQITAAGHVASLAFADLSRSESCRQLCAELLDRHAAIDIAVLNASFEVRQDLDETGDEEFDTQMHTNVRSSLQLVSMLLPAMVARTWGRLLFLGSIQELKPNSRMLTYAASKSAQTNIAINLARTQARHGVTSNVLAPGAILTDRNRGVLADPDYRRTIEKSIPANRVGVPDDCAAASLLLCSNAGGYINGAVLPVDGGWCVG